MMSKVKFHSNYKLVFLSLMISLNCITRLQAQRISRSASIDKQIEVQLNFSSFDVDISTWDKQELQVEYDIVVEAKSVEIEEAFKQKMQEVLNKQLNNLASGKVSEQSIFREKNSNGNKVTIVFSDGRDKFTLSKLEGKIHVFMPKENALNLKSRFNTVDLENLNANAHIEINSVRFSMTNCQELNLKARFSNNMKIGTIESGNLDLNSSDVDIETIIQSLYLDAKFSNIHIVSIGEDANLKLNSSSFETGNVKNLTVDGKFVRALNVKNIIKADLKLNSSNFSAETVETIIIDEASFSTIRVDNNVMMDVNFSSSSKFHIKSAKSIKCDNCKFSSFYIDELKKNFNCHAQSGKVHLRNVSNGFEEIDISGSFLTSRIHVEESSDFLISADLNFPNYRFTNVRYDKQQKDLSHEILKGWKGDKNKAVSKINFDCQSCQISVN